MPAVTAADLETPVFVHCCDNAVPPAQALASCARGGPQEAGRSSDIKFANFGCKLWLFRMMQVIFFKL